MAESSRADVMRVWRQLETELQSRRPTSSAIWIETWLNRFGGQIPRQFVVACHGDVPYPTPVKPPIAAQRMSLDEIDC